MSAGGGAAAPGLESLPGGAMIARGLQDIARGATTDESLLVFIGAPRVRRLGVEVAARQATLSPELALYERLAAADPDSAHSRYNSLIRTLVSFERALESAVR